ncbi:MAG: antitoxin MazE-like protein [Candidatus Binataceae bacterium]
MVRSRQSKVTGPKSAGRGENLLSKDAPAGGTPQFWVPDVGSPAFAHAAHAQSLAVARSKHARRDQSFINSITDRGGE